MAAGGFSGAFARSLNALREALWIVAGTGFLSGFDEALGLREAPLGRQLLAVGQFEIRSCLSLKSEPLSTVPL